MMVQGGERQFAQALIEVGDSNVDGVQLTFGAAPEIAGVVAAGKGVDLKNRSLMATLSPEDAAMTMATPNGEVQDDGTFKLKLLLPDRYRLSVYPLPPEYYIKSIRYGDTESPDAVVDLSKGASGGELTVTIAADGARIDGNVQDANEQAATGVSVVLAPDQRDYHTLYKMANTDQNGHFTIKGIKPGKYKLFAWDEVQWGQ